MAHEDINRITRELEDLLMMDRDIAPGGAENKNKRDDRERQLKAETDCITGEKNRDHSYQDRSGCGEAQEGLSEAEDLPENSDSPEYGKQPEPADSSEYDDLLEYDDSPEYEDSLEYEESQGYKGADFGTRIISWNLVRPRDSLIAAFLVPVIILLIIFAQRGIYPFGEESFLRTDMYHQYAPFFSEFRHKLAEGESLLYSWNVGMGVNFSALYAYYLASPLNWLLILCPADLVIEFMTYMIVLKTGLCGLSMAFYLKKHLGTSDFGIAFFGVFYALSGYMAAYSWNIMWLDCILLFPMIMLGLERLVRDGRGLFYCLTLGLSILSNYYISIMTCIFMVLYFIVLLVMEREMTWERFVSRCFFFVFYSLLAGGLAGLVLLPEIYALMMTASGKFNFPKLQDPYFSIIEMLARHMSNVETEIGLDHWPNIYCGVAVFMLLPLYLAAKRISGKEKAVYCIMILFFFASFSVNVLNFIWHGFHFPNSLPCRQSYIYIFLVLVMCCKAYLHLREMPWKYVLISFWGAVGFVLLAQQLVKTEHFHFSVFYVVILFLALYLGVFWLYYKGPVFRNRAILLALALVSMEAAVNMTVTSVTTVSRTAYIKDNKAVDRLMDLVIPSRGEDRFFRVEKVTRKTKNDGAWMNFPSVSLFSSTANADLTRFFKKLGCESSTNAYSITGSTPLVDMLFAVRYGLYSEDPEDTGIREFVAREEETALYRNRYTLPLGFWVSNDFEGSWDRELGSPADVQNSLADAVGASNVLDMVMDVSGSGKTLTFCPQEGGEYYAYVGKNNIEKVTVSTWKTTKTFNNVERGYLLELGYCTAGDEVTLTAEENQDDIWADVYRFSDTGLAQVWDNLAAVPWEIDRWQEAKLEGVISPREAGMMITTIPYDEGWTVLVDGQKQKTVKVLDAFIGVSILPGNHRITMEYKPEGLTQGRLITAGCAVVLLAAEIIGWCWRRRKEPESSQEEWIQDRRYD
ncbi:MAG: YfhO family protein [Lachnospiraceae bacterium]|nr:YfhO family protein [Lachnospiraceae bacterium]